MQSLQFLHSSNKAGVPIEESDFGCKRHEHHPEIWVCHAEAMSDLAKEEAHHHDHDDEDATDVHQLDSWRNQFYHGLIQDKIKTAEKGSALLEIGAGSGADAEALVEDYHLTLTDVSPETLYRLSTRNKIQGAKNKPHYVACDGEHLPFADVQFDGVYMVATFHHFESPQRALEECLRVMKPGATLVLGVEPNMFYFRPMKWFQGILYRITKTDPHHISKADAEMEGFTKNQFKTLLDTRFWEEVEIRPMWLFAGWFHYILEFLYRTFKLKKRICLPRGFEKALVAFDEFLFHIPGVKHIGWHWIVSAKKKMRIYK